jgi:hypothetical protein
MGTVAAVHDEGRSTRPGRSSVVEPQEQVVVELRRATFVGAADSSRTDARASTDECTIVRAAGRHPQ